MKKELPFSIVPVEVAFDSRLTSRHMRVLIALLSFRNRNTGLINPGRELISLRCGLPVQRVSSVTTQLVELGWLKKQGNGGRSCSCFYTFQVPESVTELLNESVYSLEETKETVTNPVTVTEIETVTNPVTKTVTNLVTKTVTNLVTGKEQTNEQTIEQIKEKNIKKEKKSDIALFIKFGVNDPVLIADFLIHRNKHKAAITLTALQGLQREGNKAGMSLADVLRECIERNWRGFKAEWLNKQGGNNANSIGNFGKLSLVERAEQDLERYNERKRRDEERERFTVVR
jgi:hypothetical protein